MTGNAHGIDISKWQHPVDWDALAAAHAAGQVDFVILRAGYGCATTDPCFAEYYRAAAARDIPCGAYWYAYWGDGTPVQEAQAFLAAVGHKSLPWGIWYDVEYEPGITGLDKAARTAGVKAALETLSASGRYVGLYASTDMVNNRLDWAQLTAWDLWVAQYGSQCTCQMPWGIWQYTSTGRVSGIDGPVDRDRAYKDYPAIITGTLATGLPGADESPAPETPAPDTAAPDPAPARTATLRTGAMTRGDLAAVLAQAATLGLYVTGTLTIGPMTGGDQAALTALLDSLAVGHEEV